MYNYIIYIYTVDTVVYAIKWEACSCDGWFTSASLSMVNLLTLKWITRSTIAGYQMKYVYDTYIRMDR